MMRLIINIVLFAFIFNGCGYKSNEEIYLILNKRFQNNETFYNNSSDLFISVNFKNETLKIRMQPLEPNTIFFKVLNEELKWIDVKNEDYFNPDLEYLLINLFKKLDLYEVVIENNKSIKYYSNHYLNKRNKKFILIKCLSPDCTDYIYSNGCKIINNKEEALGLSEKECWIKELGNLWYIYNM